MRKKIRTWTGNLLYNRQTHSLKRHLLGQNHVIVNFHRIRSESEVFLKRVFDTCPSIPVDIFREVLLTVNRNYKMVSLGTLCEHLFSRKPLAAVTFDDGWRDNYELAFPVLQELKISATVFVATGKIGSNEPFWQQKLGSAFQAAVLMGPVEMGSDLHKLISADQKKPLKKELYIRTVKKWKSLSFKEIQKKMASISPPGDNNPPRLFLNKQEIMEMSDHGIEFGAHTVDHVILTQESDGEVAFQLGESKKHLEKLLQKPVCSLAYPNGSYSRKIIKTAQNLGYIIGCSTNSRKINPYDQLLKLPRIDIGLENWKKFLISHSVGV